MVFVSRAAVTGVLVVNGFMFVSPKSFSLLQPEKQIISAKTII
jgi:hypothetical protein